MSGDLSCRGEGETVRVARVLRSGADADGAGRTLQVLVVDTVRALAGTDVRHDLLEPALGAERDERRAGGVPGDARDRHGPRVAVVVVVVAAAVHGAAGDLGHLHQGGHDLAPRVRSRTRRYLDDRRE